MKTKHWIVVGPALFLSGCAPLESGLGRVLLLVALPAAVIGGILWLLRGPGGGSRGTEHPDNERD